MTVALRSPRCGARGSWILLSCWIIANTWWTPYARCSTPSSAASRRACASSRPAESCSGCRPNTRGRLQPLDCSEPDSAAQQFFRRRAEASRPGAVTAADDGDDHGDRAPARRTSVGHRVGRRTGRHSGHRRPQRADRDIGCDPDALGRLSRRGGEPRHRTLRAAIEWSEDACYPTTPRSASASGPSSPAPSAAATRRRCSRFRPTSSTSLPDALCSASRYTQAERITGCCRPCDRLFGPASTATERRHMEYFSAAAALAAAQLQTPDEPAPIGGSVNSSTSFASPTSVPAASTWKPLCGCRCRCTGSGCRDCRPNCSAGRRSWQPLVQDRPDLRAAVDSSIAYRYVIAEQLDSAQQRARSALADAADDQTRCRALEALGDSCTVPGRPRQCPRAGSSEL